MLTVTTEWKDANIMAAAEVNKSLNEKKRKLQESIDEEKEKIEAKRGKWADSVISDMEEDLKEKTERIDNINVLLSNDHLTKRQEERVKQLRKRKAVQLFAEKRIKRRKITNQGRQPLLDSDDEDMIAKCIEDKATYHGRRQNLVMYTNRRVKKRDLLNIANHRLMSVGKRLVKSATTVFNRSKPRNSRSVQSKKHKGKGLFCMKKPPKAEDIDNENTHYQRAHVKNIKMEFFSKANELTRKFCFMQSVDDKAYLRPGTSEGFQHTRNQRILTSTDAQKARELPKYDWPEKLVYQTPGAHRIFTKSSTMSDTKEKLVTEDDNHFVFVRPKAFVGSSGTVWASETIRLRQSHPDIFEVADETKPSYSVGFRKTCSSIHCACFLYTDMTEHDDIVKATGRNDCEYTQYERTRLTQLKKEVVNAFSSGENAYSDGEKMLLTERIKGETDIMLKEVEVCLQACDMEDLDSQDFQGFLKPVLLSCQRILALLTELQLPMLKPRCCDLTDAGPGVGVTNYEVKFRDAEICRMFNSDYRVRVHRSRGDSGQGEAERTNSAIGDAVVDGSTIEWEKYKKFEGMTEEEITQLSVKQYEDLEAKRMQLNAWAVSKELVQRIDGAPVLSERIKAYLSGDKDDLFFFNQHYLMQYQAATSEGSKMKVPGSSYFKKIDQFIANHYKIGELFMEFLKFRCKRDGPGCQFCDAWSGPQMDSIPQPVPDVNNPGHYMDVFDTPKEDDDGTERKADDWQPRANITKLYSCNELSLKDEHKITEFSDKFCVKKEYVVNYLQHLTNLALTREIRSRERERQRVEKKSKTYEEYDWLGMAMNGKLSSLTISELDKYLDKNELAKKGKKSDKIRAIVADVLRKSSDEMIDGIRETAIGEDDRNGGDDSGDDSSDGDIVIDEIGSDSEESDEHEIEEADMVVDNADENEATLPLVVTTRYGRHAGSWNLFQLR